MVIFDCRIFSWLVLLYWFELFILTNARIAVIENINRRVALFTMGSAHYALITRSDSWMEEACKHQMTRQFVHCIFCRLSTSCTNNSFRMTIVRCILFRVNRMKTAQAITNNWQNQRTERRAVIWPTRVLYISLFIPFSPGPVKYSRWKLIANEQKKSCPRAREKKGRELRY